MMRVYEMIMKHAWDVYEMIMKYAWDVYETIMKYAWYVYEMFMKMVKHVNGFIDTHALWRLCMKWKFLYFIKFCSMNNFKGFIYQNCFKSITLLGFSPKAHPSTSQMFAVNYS